MSVCCVCRKRKIADVVHHKFPVDPTVSALWSEILGFERIPTQSAKVCGEHFREDDYTSYDGTTRNKLLKVDSVPSVNLANRLRTSSSPEPLASTLADSHDNVSEYLPKIEKILLKYAAPQSIQITHDSNSHTITISYSAIVDPVAPKEQKIICSKCNAIFKKPIDLQLHNKICRDNLNPYQCAKCNETFKTIADMRMHRTCKPKPPIDSHSDDSDEEEDACDDDSDDDDPNPRKACKECPRFIPVTKMRKHYARFHADKGGPFACRICNLKLDNCDDLCKHLRSHSLEKLREIRDKYPAGLHYSSKGHEYFECCLCGNVFNSDPTCSIHQDVHLKPRVRCPICQRMFNSQDGFVQHLKRHATK